MEATTTPTQRKEQEDIIDDKKKTGEVEDGAGVPAVMKVREERDRITKETEKAARVTGTTTEATTIQQHPLQDGDTTVTNAQKKDKKVPSSNTSNISNVPHLRVQAGRKTLEERDRVMKEREKTNRASGTTIGATIQQQKEPLQAGDLTSTDAQKTAAAAAAAPSPSQQHHPLEQQPGAVEVMNSTGGGTLRTTQSPPPRVFEEQAKNTASRATAAATRTTTSNNTALPTSSSYTLLKTPPPLSGPGSVAEGRNITTGADDITPHATSTTTNTPPEIMSRNVDDNRPTAEKFVNERTEENKEEQADVVRSVRATVSATPTTGVDENGKIVEAIMIDEDEERRKVIANLTVAEEEKDIRKEGSERSFSRRHVLYLSAFAVVLIVVVVVVAVVLRLTSSSSSMQSILNTTFYDYYTFQTRTELNLAVDEYLDNLFLISAATTVPEGNGEDLFGSALLDSNIGTWDVSAIGDFSRLFSSYRNPNAELLNSAAISNWDTSNARTMAEMFRGASIFNNDLSSWDLLNVADMTGMFSEARMFNESTLSIWNTRHVIAMDEMFQNAQSFNGDISAWDVSSVLSMEHMFEGALDFNRDLSDWDTSNVISMVGMFRDATRFNGNISSWDVSSVVHMEYMFEGALAYTGSDSGSISQWDVSSVTDMNSMFQGATLFNDGGIAQWNISGVTQMTNLFRGASSFNQNLCSWGALIVNSNSYQELRDMVDEGFGADMFAGTNCPSTNDPILTAVPPGPFCHECT